MVRVIKYLILLSILVSSTAYASPQFISPKQTLLDDSGDICVGCKIYFYKNSTSTPKEVYSDVGLDTSAGTSVTTDSAGRYGQVFFDGVYRVTVKDADGVTLYGPLDNCRGFGSWIMGFDLLSNYASNSLNTAVTTISTTETTLYLDADTTLTADVTVPATMSLVATKGNIITLGAYALAINGSFSQSGGLFQTFNENSTGGVTFGAGSVYEVRPTWWGENTTPGTTDMASEINSAIDSVDGIEGVVRLGIGTNRINSAIRLRDNVSLLGPGDFRSFTQCTLDCRSAIHCLYSDGNDTNSLTDMSVGGFEIDNTDNANSVDIVDIRRGCSRTSWSLKLTGATTNTSDGFVLYGHNPDTAAANASQYSNEFYLVTGSNGVIDGYALYLYGTDTSDERCNANLIQGRYDGWKNSIYINGSSNLISHCIFNGPNTGGKVVTIEGSLATRNVIIANHFDSAITGTRVSVINPDSATDPQVFCYANGGLVTVTAGSEHVQDDSGVGDEGSFFWQGYRHFVMPNAGTVSYSSATHNWVGMVGWVDDDEIVGIAGSNTANSGKIIVSGTGYAPSHDAIADNGSVSVVINDDADAGFRIVKTADGSTHTKLLSVDSSGNVYPETGIISPCPSSGRTNLDIASGVITITAAHHTVDTELDASTDNLDTINGGVLGMLLTLVAANTSRDIVLTESGNLQLGASTRTLDSSHDAILLLWGGTNWKEVSFANNGS